MHDCHNAIGRARAHSPFLARMLDRHPDVTSVLESSDIDAAWKVAQSSGASATTVARTLRLRRGACALVTGIADLAGAWSFEQVTHTLSDFADEAIDIALAAAFAERYPGEEPRGFAVIALGKHGSRELNYSSDIDPIYLFDPQTLPRRANEEPVEAAVRIARRMTELLSAFDGDGYVFRVDLRLRPSPEATPIALPVEAAIGYYESMALGWEQAAFIRGRAAAGDKQLGTYFLQAIRPFIWRRSLEFGAIEAITDISRRIRSSYANGQAFGPGYDLKRGRGGIREVEFFAQVHQMIHGGRDPSLRAGATREALVALAHADIIDPADAEKLDAAYLLFRTIEHRLQMVDDRQTHELPRNAESLANAAALHGLDDGPALLDLLRPHVEWVGTNYDKLTPPTQEISLSQDQDRLVVQLKELGFADVSAPMARIARWRNGTIRALRSASARDALEQLLPDMLTALTAAPDPVMALNRLDDCITRLPSAINFFKLLAARPGLVILLMQILSHAPTLAEALARRAELIEGLIDASALAPLPDVKELEKWLSLGEAGDDYQLLLDRVRQKVGDRRFALGVQIICGVGDPLEVGEGYGRLAEAAMGTLARAAIAEFEKAHGRMAGGELVIIALGRFAGGVLTYASDLDLIFLFTGDFSAESDGPKPLGGTQYFNRLSQRVSNALSVSTASGPLYEVDTRLRPFGTQGLLAASVDSFARYQAESAWTWEHLALTRARPVFGSDAARAQVADIIARTLRQNRDIPTLFRDAIKMRSEMARHKLPKGPLDVKLAPGGLVDLEFLVHVTQFQHSIGFHPDIATAIKELSAAGHLPAELGIAYDLLTRYLILSRLVGSNMTEPPPATQMLVAERCGFAGWPELLASLEGARQSVSRVWNAFVAQHKGE